MPFTTKFESVKVPLQHGDGRGPVDALLRVAEKRDGKFWRKRWYPRLKKFERYDGSWDWKSEIRQGSEDAGRLCLAIEVDGELQGLMSLAVLRGRCRLVPGADLVYVNLLGTAPWNQDIIQRPPKYTGVGWVSVNAAIGESAKLGFDGRIALHASPSAQVKYKRYGLEDLGPDLAYDEELHYFESKIGVTYEKEAHA